MELIEEESAPIGMSDLDVAFDLEEEPPTQSFTLDKFSEELANFREKVNENISAFEFFKCHRNEYPLLSKIAGFILGVLPSPAVAERVFSKAGFLSMTRRTRILPENLKTRLIVECNQNW